MLAKSIKWTSGIAVGLVGAVVATALSAPREASAQGSWYYCWETAQGACKYSCDVSNPSKECPCARNGEKCEGAVEE